VDTTPSQPTIRSRTRHPQVERDRIAAFRNVLVHNYLGIDLETVWRVVREEIPVLKVHVKAMTAESTRH
jgi:uncharacterized protein with HEPN domain